MEYAEFLQKVLQDNAEEFSEQRMRKLHGIYRDLSPSDQAAYFELQEHIFIPAQKSDKRQSADFDLSEFNLRFNKIFSPSAIARRSYLFLQTISDIVFGPDYYTSREDLQSYLLAKTTSGIGKLTYLNRTYELHPGDVILLDCRRYHDYRAASPEGWGYMMVHFDGIAMEDYYNQILAGGTVCFRFPQDSFFDQLLIELFSINQSNAQNCEMLTNCILVQIITEILKELPKFGYEAVPKRIQEFCDWLTAHCRERISLDEMSAAFSLSKFHISHQFKTYMDMTIFEFLHSERIKMAKGLLRYTNMTVNDISEYVGYENLSAFSRLFRQKEGLTAIKYRKQWDNTSILQQYKT